MPLQKFVRLVRLWQKRLRLLDWNIKVKFVPAGDIPDEDAHSEWDDERMQSEIEVSDALTADQFEHTVVHELLHLRLSDWTPKQYGDPKVERAVNLLCDSFLTAYKRRKRKVISV